jgi:N-acetylmuramate 1-kinase
MGDRIQITLAKETDTARLGEDLALAMTARDVVLLQGELGAGKTTIVRSLIRSMAGDETLNVPSPTFTLVQSYELRMTVHHLDLYRLSGSDLDELGIDELAETGALLIEWPERAEGRLPSATLSVSLTHEGAGRIATIEGDASAMARVHRSLQVRRFLESAGWGVAKRRVLMGDASTRGYETVEMNGEPVRILMDAPQRSDGPPIRDGKPYSRIAHLAESVLPFVAIDEALRREGFSAPEILAADIEDGLLLLEHLGEGEFLGPDRTPVLERYAAAARLLAEIHARSWSDTIPVSGGYVHIVPPYDRGAMMIEAELLIDWYLPHISGREVERKTRDEFVDAWKAVLAPLASSECSLVLRDYHSPNLIWRDDRAGLDRIGIIDFQDAVIGPAAYDVASLAMDARVTIAPEFETSVVQAYTAARESKGSFDRRGFEEAYAIMGAQRNAKILGIFVRLHRRDGKKRYLQHLPRIREYLRRCLRHPTLAPVAAFCARHGVLKGGQA